MRVSVRVSHFSCAVGLAAALWLCGSGSALAGDGGEDLGGLNSIIMGLCQNPLVNIPPASCPQVPTITQGFLEIAALTNAPPEAVRAVTNVALGLHADAGNPSRPPGLNPITAFPVEAASLSNLLSTLTPLAFASQHSGPAAVKQLYDASADTFFYAVASGADVQPDKLFLFYEDLSRTNGTFEHGRVVAKFSLPLVGVNSTCSVKPCPVIATLQISATCTGGPSCLSASFVGGIGSQQRPVAAASLGVNFQLVFGPSPMSTRSHAIFELQVPLVVTGATDPPYYSNPISFIPSPFLTDLPLTGSVGIAPSAEPWGLPATSGPATYAFCANLPGNGNGQAPIPAVAAFYAIATDGETYLSAPFLPIPEGGQIVCPF